jgi:sigma-E factor negative regulatory protein RseA
MLNRSDVSEPRRQQLSSLMDGELPGDEAGSACALWRQDPQARADWHAWHLIGDVLRSDELAARPARDAAFLTALRARLADEPVPLAPQALPAAEATQPPLQANGTLAPGLVAAPRPRRSRARGWLMAPAAMAAGFLAVVGVTLVTRQSAPDPDTATLAKADAAGAAASAVLVRNPQLDRYLTAHRALASGAMAGATGEQRMHIVFEGR